MKKFCIVIFLLFQLAAYAQNAPTPEQFLGYKIGTHFTPHYKIVNYFTAVAQAKPAMVKLEKYGQTYEGRDLMIACIASPENLKRLEAIRENNLHTTGILKDNSAALNDAPAIVWLSYNVHGNEPASSEAAMLTLFALADDNNAQTKEWLKNTVVIIDPCINPDGRDRYANWYNSVVGKNWNADPQAREHAEPWPHGRTNHYNFDLNRDWAWQTQIETRQRIKKYNEWLPQVHVDFHEQGYDAPYYFAPAAEPFHEVITPWQREFQTLIGKNNAKYFDQNGWLYFTRQEFDLFYPSYGDTYPTYNGAIGMTYEQGGISAGLGIKTDDGDTLTLVDRVTHHYTTSLATIETTSKNAGRLLSEFKKFFDNNKNANSFEYKTYVLIAKDANRLQKLANLLTMLGIEYGTASSKNFKGLNYFSGKEETFSDEGYQLAISAYQPKSTMVKVLFEAKSTLNDSVTYDITAWSLPYAYGINAYAVKDKFSIDAYKTTATVTNVQSNYGLLIPYTSLNASQVLAYLLTHKVKVRCAQKPFTYNNKTYKQGTLIVLKGSNVADWNVITNNACKQFNVQPDEVESGFVEKGADFGSGDVKFIHSPKVALVTGAQVSSLAAGEVWHFFDETLNYPITLINAEDIKASDLSKYNVLILPDGNYKILNDKQSVEQLKNFAEAGGSIIAMENAVAQMANENWGLKLKEDKDADKDTTDYSDLKIYGNSQRDQLRVSIPGAIYKVELDNTHPLAFGYANTYYTLKQDAHVYEFIKQGWNVGVIKQQNYVAGFVGSKLKPKLKDGLLFGTQNLGDGNLIFLADNPLFRLFWENGKMLFANAVFFAGQ